MLKSIPEIKPYSGKATDKCPAQKFINSIEYAPMDLSAVAAIKSGLTPGILNENMVPAYIQGSLKNSGKKGRSAENLAWEYLENAAPLMKIKDPTNEFIFISAQDDDLGMTHVKLQQQVKNLEQKRQEPIAVTGLGCRFPGGANSPDAFWQMLRDGVYAVREVPAERWDIDAYYDPDPDAPGMMSTRWAGFIEGIDQFDPHLFNISPREANTMDPQQRLLLEVAWEALEHAGQAPDKLSHICIGQSKITDSLKAELSIAREDTTRLKIYMALGHAGEKKDKLLYAEPAWSLVDNLFLIEKRDNEREKLIETERSLPYFITAYHTKNNTTDWDKAMGYLNNRLLIIEKKGDKKRTAEFLNLMAGLYLDDKRDSAMFRKYMLKSIAIAKEINDSALIVRCYGFMFSFYTSAANLTVAFEAVQSSIAITRQMNYNKGLASSLTMLAELYGFYNEDEQALENYQAALNIVNKIKDTSGLYNTLLSWGDFYRKRKNKEKAYEYYNKLLMLSSVNNNPGLRR